MQVRDVQYTGHEEGVGRPAASNKVHKGKQQQTQVGAYTTMVHSTNSVAKKIRSEHKLLSIKRNM